MAIFITYNSSNPRNFLSINSPGASRGINISYLVQELHSSLNRLVKWSTITPGQARRIIKLLEQLYILRVLVDRFGDLNALRQLTSSIYIEYLGVSCNINNSYINIRLKISGKHIAITISNLTNMLNAAISISQDILNLLQWDHVYLLTFFEI